MARWTRQHEERRRLILELLSRHARPFADTSDEAAAARRALPYFEWCATYLPHYFSVPPCAAHYRLIEAVGEPGLPTFVCAFRGFGKSVHLALARPLWRTLGRQVPYWLYGAGTQRLAAQNMDYVRIELEHNERIRCDYPDLRVEGEETEWTVDLSQLGGRSGPRSAKFEAFGTGMSPRGRRHGQYRPLEFVGDDLEWEELARNPRREQQLWDWLTREVVPALEPDRYVMTVLGTMFGPKCLMERAKAEAARVDPGGRPLARFHRQPATDEAGHSVWTERFSDEFLARQRMIVGPLGWMREYMMIAEDPALPFQPAWFRSTWGPGLRVADLDVVAFLDPALSEAPTGCPRALVVVGCDRRTGERYVLDAWIERGTPEEMCDRLYAVHERWHPRVIGIESNGGYALLRPLLNVWAERKRFRLPVRYVTHSRAKDLRIAVLVPQMESGRWHWPARPSAGVNVLIEQFLAYPNGFVDGPDATAGCDELLPSAWGGGRPAGEPVYHALGRRRELAAIV